MKKTEKILDTKQITFYRNDNEYAPIVYINMYTDAGREVLEGCKKLGCKPFHLVTITKIRWDEELSPWASKPIVSKNDHFTGKADNYIRFMAKKIIPFTEKEIEPQYRVIAGYSMGGLFALYVPYVTDLFSKVVSVSGSVWYPDFVSYARQNEFLQMPESIYLSIGDSESRTKNVFLQQTENNTRKLHSVYQSKNINSIFELNPGNHYKDAPYRMAKGITWILNS